VFAIIPWLRAPQNEPQFLSHKHTNVAKPAEIHAIFAPQPHHEDNDSVVVDVQKEKLFFAQHNDDRV
jgi:hypothetical protein